MAKRTKESIEVRGARVHNLKNIDVSVPLNEMVGIAGVSGSGKSSLALGVLYAEGSRRYLEALSTYTRRRLSQSTRADVESVEHIPAALALRQRPGVPGVRSTFGTSTEILNVVRLMFSRLASHKCPNGHYNAPTMRVALDLPITCATCGISFKPPSAEQLAFNSEGACPHCGGIGTVREVDDSRLVPDDSLSIDDGAVKPWTVIGFMPMPYVAAALGVRTDVPFRELTEHEREIVFTGPPVKQHIDLPTKNGKIVPLNWTYRNAHDAVQEAISNAKSDRSLDRVERFITVHTCPVCHGTRLSPAARAPRIEDANLADASAQPLSDLLEWVQTVPPTMPKEMVAMSHEIIDQLLDTARPLIDLGLGYLSLDRSAATLSTGERQRSQLSRAVRNRTTGVLYVLDEPSIGLHPSNVDGLLEVMDALIDDGNSVVVVDHDVQVLRRTAWLIEIGPGSGTQGGEVIAQGTPAQLEHDPHSRIGPFLDDAARVTVRTPAEPAHTFDLGRLHLETAALHTVHPLSVDLPIGRLIAVTGVSGSGKSTLVLESLVPALQHLDDEDRPAHIKRIDPAGIANVHVVDATPIGANVRSTVATYSGVMDALRVAWGELPAAREKGLSASDFSYNTGSLRCPTCDGTGTISLDVQFLPDVDITCPTCDGSRYSPDADAYIRPDPQGGEGRTLPKTLELTAADAVDFLADLPGVQRKLQTLIDIGLGYLTLGEATPVISGGEAQRLKLASQLGRDQRASLFVLDEPTVGLHPLDVQTLLGVLQRLIDRGATVLAIEHDLDVIGNADYVVDLGPGGGEAGGRIVATGTPTQIAAAKESVTGKYLR